jgi:hypothetical protein
MALTMKRAWALEKVAVRRYAPREVNRLCAQDFAVLQFPS